MRVYLPSGHRLGASEVAAMRRLSRRSLALLADELREPGSRETVRWVLRQRDPERALAEAISENVRQAVRFASSSQQGEPGRRRLSRLHRNLSKRVARAAERVLKRVVPSGLSHLGASIAARSAKHAAKVARRSAKHAAKVKAHEKIVGERLRKRAYHRAVSKGGFFRKFGKLLITAFGAVLAPFTGGASMAAASLLTAGMTMIAAKKQAKRIAQTNSEESARIDAQVREQEKELSAKLDKMYDEHAPIFEGAGVTRDKWNALTVEQKLAVIEKINKKQMPATPAAIQEQAAEQGVAPPSVTSTPDWMSEIQDTSISRASAEAESQRPEGVPGAPSGNYELYVEGRKLFQSGSSQEVSVVVGRDVKPGDRFEVLFNGKSLGLKLRVSGGVISVPKDQEARVRAMSKPDVQVMVARATANAERAGAAGDGGFPIWALAIPAIAIAASA